MTEQQFCQVAVTFDSRTAADELVVQIIQERLAACAQINGPITSTFWWQGTMDTSEEWRVDFKTRLSLLDALTSRIAELHSYDTPEIVATPIIGGWNDYLAWVDAETAAADRAPVKVAAAG